VELAYQPFMARNGNKLLLGWIEATGNDEIPRQAIATVTADGVPNWEYSGQFLPFPIIDPFKCGTYPQAVSMTATGGLFYMMVVLTGCQGVGSGGNRAFVYSSADGVNWNGVGAVPVVLGNSFYSASIGAWSDGTLLIGITDTNPNPITKNLQGGSPKS